MTPRSSASSTRQTSGDDPRGRRPSDSAAPAPTTAAPAAAAPPTAWDWPRTPLSNRYGTTVTEIFDNAADGRRVAVIEGAIWPAIGGDSQRSRRCRTHSPGNGHQGRARPRVPGARPDRRLGGSRAGVGLAVGRPHAFRTGSAARLTGARVPHASPVAAGAILPSSRSTHGPFVPGASATTERNRRRRRQGAPRS